MPIHTLLLSARGGTHTLCCGSSPSLIPELSPLLSFCSWDIIQEAKVGRAIVLTTHSMEEADILGEE